MNIIKNANRVVVQVGSSTLTYENGKLNLARIERLVRVLADYRNAGKEVVLVSSGAICAGAAVLRFDHRPASTPEKQAAAAVGQSELMRLYANDFANYGYPVGQLLLTREVIDNQTARQNAINTLEELLAFSCVPIVNENDTISFEEIEIGDNDTLSAYVAVLCHADALILLSDIDGFYDSDPRTNPNAKLIPTVAKIDDSILACAGDSATNRGTGGLITKLHAAGIAGEAGIPMFLVNGSDPAVLYDLIEGRHVGTYFMSGGAKD